MKGNHVFRFFPIFDKNSLINRRKRSFLFSLSLLSLQTHLSPLSFTYRPRVKSFVPCMKTSSVRRVALSTCTQSSQRNFLFLSTITWCVVPPFPISLIFLPFTLLSSPPCLPLSIARLPERMARKGANLV